MMRRATALVFMLITPALVYGQWDPKSYYKGAFKKMAGVAHTANVNDPPNEAIGSQVSIGLNQVMGQTIPGTMGSCDPQDAVDLGIVEYWEVDLDLVSGSDNKCYELAFPGDYDGDFGTGVQGDPIRESTFVIPLAYNSAYAASDHGGGYGPDLYDDGGRIPPTSSTNWWLDPYAGTITSETNLGLGSTGTVRVYLYTGKLISDILKLNNYEAASDPTTDDDGDDGYDYGSFWLNTSSQEVFFCVLPTVSAAVWVSITASCDCPTAEEIATAVWTAEERGLTEDVAADIIAISGDEAAADDFETMLDGTGGEVLSLGRLVIVSADNDTGVDITASGTGAAVQISSSDSGPAVKVDSAAASYPVFDLNATNGNTVFDIDVTGGSGNAVCLNSLAGSTAVQIYGGTHGIGIYGVHEGMTIQSIADGHALELISEGAGNHALALQQFETDKPAIAWPGATVLEIEGSLTGSVNSVTEPVDLVDAPNATAITAIQNGLSTHDEAAVVAAMFEYAPDVLSFESLMEAIQAVQVGVSTRDGLTITHYRNDGVTPKVTGTIRGDRTRMSVEIAD